MSPIQLFKRYRETLGIFENTLRFNEELASIKNTYAEDRLICSVAHHLEAIFEETTAATGEIMAAAASTQVDRSDLKVQIKYCGADRLFDNIRVNVWYIVEACSFHHITTECRAKVARAINAIEGALNTLAIIFGEDVTAALKTVDRATDRIDGGIKF